MAAADAAVFGIAIIIFIGWCVQWYIHILAIIYGKWRLHKKVKTRDIEDDPLPGVSILKPLTGVDPNLYQNLQTFFTMKYPKYELLFCVEEDLDPAIMVVNSLLEKYPKTNATLFIGAQRVGINPKINNMIQGYDAAKYDLILISDSGLVLKEDTLLDMVTTMTDSVGLVHQLPFVADRDGFSSVLEKVHFGTWLAKMYLSADLFGVNCVTGMSCLFRKQLLTDSGGLRALAQFLAEDFYLGQKCIDKGWKTAVSSQPAMQNAGSSSVLAYQHRMMRWSKLRVSLLPSLLLLEPLTECCLLGAVSGWAVTVVFGWSALAFFFVHLLLWFMFDYCLLSVIQNGPFPFSKFELVIGWLFRECTTLYLWLKAHSTYNLVWRSKVFKLYWGGVGEEIRQKQCV